MNWPAPTLDRPDLPPPNPDGRSGAAGSTAEQTPDSAETPEERRRLSAVPAAAWVAVLGGVLVLLAAAIVVASNWDSLGSGMRLAGLVLGTVGLLAAAERLRQLVPTTAGIVAHVGTFLTAACGIAGMSLFGFTWPTCLLVGGAIAVAATEYQARRWERSAFHVGQVAAIAMASTGLAALTGTTAGLVAAIAGLGLLVAGAQRRAAGTAVLAVLSPALTALAEAGIGAGTFERAGLIGESLSWSGPVVGVLAAMILGVVAQQRQNNGLMLTAVASPVIGLVTGWAAVDGSAVAWLSVPALVVIAAELGWWMLPSTRFRSQIGGIFDVLGTTLASLALASPWLVTQLDLSNTGIENPWAIPAAVTGLAIVLAVARWRQSDQAVADVGVAAAAATAVALMLALGVPAVGVALTAVMSVGVAAFFSRRLRPVAIYLPAFWAAVSIVELDPTSSTGMLALAATLFVTLLAIIAVTRARLADDSGWFGWIELLAVAGASAGIATELVDGNGAVAALVGATLAVVVFVLAAPRLLPAGAATLGLVGVLAGDAASPGGTLEPTFWIGCAVAGVGMAVLWLRTRSPIASYGAASMAVITLATSAAAFDISAERYATLALAVMAVLTGLAFTLQRRTPLDAAAVTAGLCLLVATTFEIDPSWISGIWFAVGLQLFVYGVGGGSALLRLLGAFTTLSAAVSWWFTTGLDDWMMQVLEPADIRAGDLWMLAATAAAFLAGWALRSSVGVNSWIACSGGLTIAGLWLTSVQIERDTVWAIPLALTIGIAAVAIGAWRRLAALLIGGTTLVGVTVFVAAGSDLTAIPTWSWLAVGGLALLGIAVLIERGGKPGTADLRQLIDRWD